MQNINFTLLKMTSEASIDTSIEDINLVGGFLISRMEIITIIITAMIFITVSSLYEIIRTIIYLISATNKEDRTMLWSNLKSSIIYGLVCIVILGIFLFIFRKSIFKRT